MTHYVTRIKIVVVELIAHVLLMKMAASVNVTLSLKLGQMKIKKAR